MNVANFDGDPDGHGAVSVTGGALRLHKTRRACARVRGPLLVGVDVGVGVEMAYEAGAAARPLRAAHQRSTRQPGPSAQSGRPTPTLAPQGCGSRRR